MGANGSDENDRVLRVRKRPASGEVISSRTSWGSDANSIGEQGGEMFVVPEQFDLRHSW
jgi:hypothetical protein